MQKLSSHTTLIGTILSVSMLIMAGWLYPGGNPTNAQAIGFDWTRNYISNMLEYKAVNGLDNPARPVAIAGVMLMGVVLGLALVRFSTKIQEQNLAAPIKYLAYLEILLSLLITVPGIHMQVVMAGSIVTLLLFFYITVTLFRSKLTTFKVMAVAFMLLFYSATFMFYSKTGFIFMPIMQKLVHIAQFIWILSLEYGTKKSDFDHINA